jgi:hypothetical protein
MNLKVTAKIAPRVEGLWMQTILYAALIVLFMLSLYYYWFALANWHTIFLYNHLGATPFDSRSVGRYLMTGTVYSNSVREEKLDWTKGSTD